MSRGAAPAAVRARAAVNAPGVLVPEVAMQTVPAMQKGAETFSRHSHFFTMRWPLTVFSSEFHSFQSLLKKLGIDSGNEMALKKILVHVIVIADRFRRLHQLVPHAIFGGSLT
jgi:hypothetical protein